LRDHPETNLANSDYMPDMKVEKTQDPSIFLATYWNSLSKSGDLIFYLNFFFFEIWRIWTIFPMKNPLYWLKSYFASQIFAKICQ
jgi:hypothetical protein